LSDGIADNLTNSLSRLPGLTVISSSAVARYKISDPQAADPPVQAIGREFKVQAVVIGKVVQRADRINIKVELTDARENTQLWGEQYDRKLTDIFGMQEDISRSISEKLKLKLTGQEQSLLTRRYTENTEAYQSYLKGRYFWNKRTAEGLRKAIQFFDQAIGMDPNYASAYAGLADSYQLFSFYSGLPPTAYAPRAREAAERAIAIDDSLAEAHTTLAYVRFYYDWNWPGAEAEFKRAIELNPNYATAHQWYGEYLGNMGRRDESLVERRKALALDPLSPIITSELGYSYFEAGQYDRAVEEFRKATEIFPDFSPAHSFLAMAYERIARYEEAIAECQKAIALANDNSLLTQLARIYAMSGRPVEAQRLLAEMRQESKQRYFSSSQIAKVYAVLNDKEQAFAWLEKACEERDWGLIALKVYPWPDSLRSDARFSDLLKRMNLLP
jgi:TolB-like protein/Tfp pilus assembly protein PilF